MKVVASLGENTQFLTLNYLRVFDFEYYTLKSESKKIFRQRKKSGKLAPAYTYLYMGKNVMYKALKHNISITTSD